MNPFRILLSSTCLALGLGLALQPAPAHADQIKIAVVTHGQSSDS